MSHRAVEVSSSSRQLPARVYYEFDTKLTAQFVPTRCWRYSCNPKLCHARAKQRNSILGPAGLHLWQHTTDLSNAKDYTREMLLSTRKQCAETTGGHHKRCYLPTNIVRTLRPFHHFASAGFLRLQLRATSQHTVTMASNDGNGADL